jgi:hypothetical protein
MADYIERDEYTGKWQVTPKAPKVGAATAGQLAEVAGTAPIVLWEHSGTARSGRALFTRHRYVANAEGGLNGYDSDGRLIIRHPADRVLRYLTK